MTRVFLVFVIGLLVSRDCSPRSLPEEDSVVSVYTTQANSHSSVDVYHQIANNIAERITSPIYRFLGIGQNTTQSTPTKRLWDKIELLDDGAEDAPKSATAPINNDISNDKDVEELSADALKKIDKKPEKITLYSSYLPPVKGNIELNDTAYDDDNVESFGLDDVDDEEVKPKPKDGFFVFAIEFIGSLIQLIYGSVVTLFTPKKSS
ncbi:uncharacterized protein LOC123663326 [Melitaea cinxia]|uniref:uncharacterized protein LOC123663326 n=1 Tax=Melitaea cinxia TaxID=113334 RepID=UPI001E270D76|nr:uncharacterized protein LOC123663326 [Melitaea cinxia]